MFGGSSEYTVFHDVGSVHVFLFFAKGTVRELENMKLAFEEHFFLSMG